MANPEHLQVLQQSVEAWNAWRDQHTDPALDLGEVDLTGAPSTGPTSNRCQCASLALAIPTRCESPTAYRPANGHITVRPLPVWR
jgi:hypothetical protein